MKEARVIALTKRYHLLKNTLRIDTYPQVMRMKVQALAEDKRTPRSFGMNGSIFLSATCLNQFFSPIIIVLLALIKPSCALPPLSVHSLALAVKMNPFPAQEF
jgi:hypothetical protein